MGLFLVKSFLLLLFGSHQAHFLTVSSTRSIVSVGPGFVGLGISTQSGRLDFFVDCILNVRYRRRGYAPLLSCLQEIEAFWFVKFYKFQWSPSKLGVFSELGATLMSYNDPVLSVDDLADQVAEVLNYFGRCAVMCMG